RDESLRQSVLEALWGLPGIGLRTIPSAADAAGWAGCRGLAVVLAHLTAPGDAGPITDLLRDLAATRRPVATLVVGELGTAEPGLALIRQGAADFLERPLNLRHFAYL